MAQQTINVGTTANDGTGDTLRAAGQKINANFTEVYGDVAGKAATGHGHSDATTSVPGFMSIADKTKLDGVAAGATANSTDVALRDRTSHTGSQLAATISDFAATVRATVLTGFTGVTAAAIVATDTVLQALQKVQAQLDGKLSSSLATAVTAASADPAENDQLIWTLTADTDAPRLGAISRLRKRLATESIGTGLATTGTVNLDFAALLGTKQRIAATGNITFTGSNYADGQTFQVRVDANGATRTLAYPADWKRIGAALPTSIVSGEIVLFAFSSNGTAEASIDVAAAKSV